MYNCSTSIGIAIVVMFLQEALSSDVLKSTSSTLIKKYYSNLSPHWEDDDIQLFLSKYIDYTFPNSERYKVYEEYARAQK